ncbi:hypothetical protein CDEST_01971 [Colletotrichum destructivum]|uniref:F-box domain-containing protein n=1 Tax=Colletotrichum destructivum TaxID=34406 RepID=A0AAX4I0V0_9PEZI|nr:hypothetical protein CDEST_01971 [Colletotrichum destructivum]
MEVPLPPISKLSLEIIRLIVSSPELSTKDRKSLRLTCKWFKQPTEERLFHRICISQLQSEVEAFLRISASPHLAILVREIVWLERPQFTYEDVEAWIEDLERPVSVDQRTRFLQSFWRYDESKIELNSEDDEGTEQTSSLSLGEYFPLAILRMPRVATFVSQHLERQPRNTYHASDEEILLFHGPRGPGIPNEGFFKFLQPAMECPQSTVRNLVWTQEFENTLDQTFIPAAFRSLTSIDIRFHRLPQWKNLVDCLCAASGLRKLSLASMDNHHEPHVFGQISRSPRWEHLTVVHFNKIRVSDEDLTYFVECHGTLYHLRVIGWYLRVETKRNVEDILRRAKLEFDADNVDGEDRPQS